MSKICEKKRRFVIRLKKKTRKKVDKLRKAYKRASSEEERKKILEKALRKNPNLTVEEFLKYL